jgi:hypothetical protein
VLVFYAIPEGSERKHGQRGAALYCVRDATIAACYAQIAGTAQGLASRWVGAFDEAAPATALNALRQLRSVALMPIGYAAEALHRPRRRTLEELVHRGAEGAAELAGVAEYLLSFLNKVRSFCFALPLISKASRSINGSGPVKLWGQVPLGAQSTRPRSCPAQLHQDMECGPSQHSHFPRLESR